MRSNKNKRESVNGKRCQDEKTIEIKAKRTKSRRKKGETIVLEFNLSKSVAIITLIIILIMGITTKEVVDIIIEAKQQRALANENISENVTMVKSTTKDAEGNEVVETDSNGNEITVPVPKGYTASKIDGETSVNQGLVIYEGDITDWSKYTTTSAKEEKEVTFKEASEEETKTYNWILEDDGTHRSGYVDEKGNACGNYNADNTTNTLTTEEFTLDNSGKIVFDWAVSSEANDYLYYVVTNTSTNEVAAGGESTKISGTTAGTDYSSLTYSTVEVSLDAGTYKVEFVYVKDGQTSSGLDAGHVKNIKAQVGYKGVEFTIDTTATYHWSQYDDGTYVSGHSGSGGNYNAASTTNTLTSDEFTLGNGGKIKFEWSVSSESVSWDYLYYTIKNASTNATVVGGTSNKIGGTSYGTEYNSLTFMTVEESLSAGTYKIEFTYRKDSGGNNGLDAGFVRNVMVTTDLENATETSEEELTFENASYNWKKNDDNVWTSQNTNINNSISKVESEDFTVNTEAYLTFDWAVSSEANDYLYYTITNTSTNATIGGTSTKISGTTAGTEYSSLTYSSVKQVLNAGTYKIEFVYVKDNQTSSGLDTGYVKNVKTEDAYTQADVEVYNLQTTTNQYVWVPVDNIDDIYGVDSNGKLWGKLYNFTTSGTTALNWTETNGVINITNKTNYREPSTTTENNSNYYEVDSGYYMRNYLKGNTQYEMLAQEMEENFYKMIKSVKEYGGFYIGRYETGGLSGTAVVKKMNTDIASQTWYTMYKKCQNLKGSNENVETSMIWGSLWDETLKWLESSGATTSNGTDITYALLTNS